MNYTVKEMLQLRKDPISLYALKRIEFLEGAVKSFSIHNISSSFNLNDLIEFTNSVSFDGADKEDLIAFLNDR